MAITLTKEALMVHEDMNVQNINFPKKFSDTACSLCIVLTIEYMYAKSSFSSVVCVLLFFYRHFFASYEQRRWQ